MGSISNTYTPHIGIVCSVQHKDIHGNRTLMCCTLELEYQECHIFYHALHIVQLLLQLTVCTLVCTRVMYWCVYA